MKNFGLFSIMASGTRSLMAQIAHLDYIQSDVKILYRPDEEWGDGDGRYAQFHRVMNPRQIQRSLVVPLRHPHKTMLSHHVEYSGFNLYDPLLLMMQNFIGYCKIAEELGTEILYVPIDAGIPKEVNWDRLCEFTNAGLRPFPRDEEFHVGKTGKGEAKEYEGVELPVAEDFYEERVKRVLVEIG